MVNSRDPWTAVPVVAYCVALTRATGGAWASRGQIQSSHQMEKHLVLVHIQTNTVPSEWVYNQRILNPRL
jgi:hypothetical protein